MMKTNRVQEGGRVDMDQGEGLRARPMVCKWLSQMETTLGLAQVESTADLVAIVESVE